MIHYGESMMDEAAIQDREILNKKGATTLARLLPRLEAKFSAHVEEDDWLGYVERLRKYFNQLFRALHSLYGTEYDFFYHMENILTSATQMWIDRPGELKALDALRETDPYWYQSHRMVGAMCYVDLFAGDLKGLAERIPYLSELGITYLHLMPIFKSPEGDNDGGYAVSSYREVDPDVGTMEDLELLATELRHRGISLALDFVFNHTSDEHEWARGALEGNREYQEYYRMFPDRRMPDAYERSIAAVFPDELPGCFTYRNAIRKWVWTSFYNFQWDLNYANPVVFNRMLEEMLFLANRGVEVLRLDAIAFIWKQLGTGCQNLPQAHVIVQAFNAITSIVAPAMVFKSEAIVHPDEVRKYVGEDECELSYNPQLMALLWEALATRDVRVLRYAMRQRFTIPGGCSWVNYVRCHDDIGWAFADDEVEKYNFDPAEHRLFLTKFYTGNYEGSFARGATFQEDPKTGDARVSGTCASLAGLEQAVESEDESLIDLAIRRIHLLHGIIITIGGIPLLYLGDELGTLNDYDYERSMEKLGDSRWLHRSRFDWDIADKRRDPESIQARIYSGIARLVQLRQQNLAFSRAETEFVETGNDHVFAYFRTHENHSALVLANFSETPQTIEAWRLRQLGMRRTMVDLISGRTIIAAKELTLEPYQFIVLSRSI
jgi:amylosucrase/maltose alpha-D-glucosyltransferase/alpha-amylase